MPPADAVRLARREMAGGEITVHVGASREPLIVRGGTSDVYCLNKVLLDEEYRYPSSLSTPVIVDAGANVGYATRYFAHRHPGVPIVAIEPSPENFAILRRNCASLPNVTLLNAAVWPSRTRLTLTNPLGEAWAYAVSERHSGGTSVGTITVPDILEMTQSDRIGLLKLDVEGSERELFSQGSDAWLDRVDHITIELHDRFRPGCAAAFYAALGGRNFTQEVIGENVCISLARHLPGDAHGQ